MSNTVTGQIPAGWYADPADTAKLRWWNGTAWSEHTQDVVVVPPVPVEPIPLVARHQPVPTHAPPTHFTPPPGYAPGYVAANTYGMREQAIAEKPQNLPGRLALLFGILSILVGIISVVHILPSLLSLAGVAAIVNGVIALHLVGKGRATARIRPIIGIVLGSLGSLLIIVSVLGVFANQLVTITGANASAGSTTAPPPPSPTEPLDVRAKGHLPDQVVGSYIPFPIKTVAAKSIGCTALTEPRHLPALGSDSETQLRTDGRILQDQMWDETGYIATAIESHAGPTEPWPTVLYEDIKSRMVFERDCTVLGSVPLGATLEYAQSPDKQDFAVAMHNDHFNLIEMFRSVDNSLYNL